MDLENLKSNFDVETFRYVQLDSSIDDPDNHPRLAFLFRIKYDHENQQHMFWFTYARTSEKDQFSKKEAQELLYSRMNEDKFLMDFYDPNISLIQNLYITLLSVLTSEEAQKILPPKMLHNYRLVYNTLVRLDIMNNNFDRFTTLADIVRKQSMTSSSNYKEQDGGLLNKIAKFLGFDYKKMLEKHQ